MGGTEASTPTAAAAAEKAMPRKKHSSRAETDAAGFNTAEGHSYTDEQEYQEDWLLSKVR